MHILELIEKKRDALELTTEEIQFFVREYGAGAIPDYQASALLMAIYLNKMNDRETLDLAMAMATTGDTLSLDGVEGVKVDKHSSGGVGDKATLIVAPMVAACGLRVAKMSGRGLGFSGGTIDKLESFTGFRTSLEPDDFVRLVNTHGIAVMGQTANVAPVDKKLYALRDVTGTVANRSLIASSIMSKKLACQSDAIVLDVKVGSGAFMKTLDEAVGLARAMVSIGTGAGRRVAAAITNMDEPLGHAVGNALEVAEVIQTLRGRGPADLVELCLVIGGLMLEQGQLAAGLDEARAMLSEVLQNGAALAKFREFIVAQGGDGAQVDDPARLPGASVQIAVPAPSGGVVAHISTDEVGKSTLVVGAGRFAKDDPIDLGAGVIIHKKVGDTVRAGEALCTVHCNDEAKGREAAARLAGAFTVADEGAPHRMLRALVSACGEEVYG